MKRDPFFIGALVLALLVMAFQVWSFSKCRQREGFYSFRDMQCLVIPGVKVTS